MGKTWAFYGIIIDILDIDLGKIHGKFLGKFHVIFRKTYSHYPVVN